MTDKKYILSFDQGTTSSRAVLFDSEFNIAGIEQQESRQMFPHPGWVEQDAVEIWESQLFVARKLINRMGIDSNHIAGIGITNQRETTLVWNKNTGKPIYNAIIWQDRRTTDFCNQLKEEDWSDYIRNTTGLIIDSYFSATKLKWILENVPGALKAAQSGELLFGTVDTWLIWNLTAGKKHITDVSNASRTMMFDFNRLRWDEKLLELFGIPICMLPQVVDSSSNFGASEKGIIGKGRINIGGIAGDQQAALFGQACFEEGMIKNTYGTGCFMLMNTGEKPKLSSSGLISTIAWSINGKLTYAIEGSVFIAGAAIKWLRDGLHLIREASDSEEYADAVPDSAGVIVVPAFAGLGAPYWDMKARGAVFGLTQGVNEKHFVRATLESLAYQTRDVIEAMQLDTGMNIKVLKVDGGACANNYLMQFQSDMLNVKVLRPKIIESTALGAAYLAGLSTGFTDVERIIDNQLLDREFSPQMMEYQRNQLYSNWKKAVSRCFNWQD